MTDQTLTVGDSVEATVVAAPAAAPAPAPAPAKTAQTAPTPAPAPAPAPATQAPPPPSTQAPPPVATGKLSMPSPAPTLATVQADIAAIDAKVAQTGQTAANDITAAVGKLDPNHALQEARVASSKLHQLLHNVATPIDLVGSEARLMVNNLLATLRHLI